MSMKINRCILTAFSLEVRVTSNGQNKFHLYLVRKMSCSNDKLLPLRPIPKSLPRSSVFQSHLEWTIIHDSNNAISNLIFNWSSGINGNKQNQTELQIWYIFADFPVNAPCIFFLAKVQFLINQILGTYKCQFFILVKRFQNDVHTYGSEYRMITHLPVENVVTICY